METLRVVTADGSHTLYVPHLNEHYHSVHGAVQESLHVYIEAGLNSCDKKQINVLEFGFGTGLNAWLSYLEARRRKLSIHYTALEKFPLPENITGQLHYTNQPEDMDVFHNMHKSGWNKFQQISPFFMLNKIQTDFIPYEPEGNYDVVYYDAFGPDKQPDAWSQEIFNRIAAHMNPDGILTTYCAKGAVRRMLQQAGFEVERIPGPPGKREMLKAKFICK